MKHKITNNTGITLEFPVPNDGAVRIPLGETEHEGLPLKTLQGMKDAGLRVELVKDTPFPATEPEKTEG